MSGHSKWSTIKRQKGAADAKRGITFGKLTNAIILAAKRGGGNPDANFELKMMIDKARLQNLPKDNIERAIKRGTGEIGGAAFEEVLYEAIGIEGVGILIEAATDNRNRTTAEVKNALSKYGAKFASSGAVNYQFDRLGKIIVDLTNKSSEEAELAAIEAGAEDFDEQGEVLAVFTKINELESMKRTLEAAGLEIKEAILSWEPKTIIRIGDKEKLEKLLSLMQLLEELDDVSCVYSNFDVDEALV